jgi:hypothetical protein
MQEEADSSGESSGMSFSDNVHESTVKAVRGLFGEEAASAVDKALPILGDLVLLRWL